MNADNTGIFLDVTTLQMIFYVGIPLVAELVTRRFADGRIKAGVVMALALLASVVQEVIQAGDGIQLTGLLGKFIMALGTAFLTHKYIWKPALVTGDRGAIQNVVPMGVGKVDPLKVDDDQREQQAA